MENRHNDWIATLINTKDRSDVSFASLYANGITPDNIILHDEDYYKDIPQVQKEFTENGKFNDDKFDEFYKNAVATYNYYSNEDYKKTFIETIPTSPYSVESLNDPSKPTQNISPIIIEHKDRNRRTFGAENIWQIGNPNFSDSEVAQANKMRDEDGNVLDWSPNDRSGFFRSIFRKPAALATYDEDGYYINEYTGEEEWHTKGEVKLDKTGDPYFQQVGNNDTYGKIMLHPTDTFTTEGSIWNKVDIFDSDGLKTDPAKVIARTAFKIAPFLIPGVREVYGTVSALLGIGAAFPTLAKSIDGFITRTDDNQFGRSMTVLENWARTFEKSQPQEIQGKFFTFENIADIVASSVNQFATQRAVGTQAVKLLGLKPAQATQVALGYMALTSTTDAYGEAKQAGANDQVAGLVSLGSTAAMYGLMQAGYFKDNLTRGTILDEDTHIRRNLKELTIAEAKRTWGENLGKVSFKPGWWADKLEEEKTIGHFLANCRAKGIEMYRRVKMNAFGSPVEGYFSRAMNEGIEEVMEEASADFIKGLTLGMQKLGLNISEDPNSSVDYGFSPQDFISRYGAAFMGGAIGGAVFEGVGNLEYLQDPHLRKLMKTDAMTRVYADLMNDPDNSKYESYIKAAQNLKIGDKNLSALKSFEAPKGVDQKTFYAQGTENDNQRQYMRTIMTSVINTVHDIINEEGLADYDNEEVLKMILASDELKQKAEKEGKDIYEYLSDTSDEGAVNRIDALVIAMKNTGILDRAVIDTKNIGIDIVKTAIDLKGLRAEAVEKNKFTNNEEVENYLKSNAKYQHLNKKLSDLKKKYSDALHGNLAADYFGEALMVLKDSPKRFFLNLFTSGEDYKLPIDIETYAQSMHNIDYNKLTEEEKEELNEEYKAYMAQDGQLTWRIYHLYKQISLNNKELLEKINTKFKDSKADPFAGNIHAKGLAQLTEQLKQLTELAKNLEKEGKQDTDEYRQVQGAAEQTKMALMTGAVMSPDKLMNVSLDTKKLQEAIGHKNIDENDLSDNNSLKDYLDTVKDYLTYVRDNHIIPVDKLLLLHNLFINLGSNLNTTKDLVVTQEDGSEATQDSKVSMVNRRIARIPKKIARQFLIENGLGAEADAYITQEQADADPNGNFDGWDIAFSEILTNHPDLFPELKDAEFVDEAIQQVPALLYKKYGPKVLQEGLVERIENIQNLLASNFLEGVEELNKFIADLQTAGNPEDWLSFFQFDDFFQKPADTSVKGIVSWLVFNDLPLLDFIQEVTPLLDSIEESPLEGLLQTLSITLNGEKNNVITLINSQWNLLRNVSASGEFETSNEVRQALERAVNILNLASAIIEGAGGGYNETYNTRSKTKLAVLNENTMDILGDELKILKQRAEYLLSLSGINLSQRFEEEQRFLRVDTRTRVKYFVEPPDDKKSVVEEVTKVFKNYFGSDFSWDALGDIHNWDFEDTDEKVESFDAQRVKFQRALYELYTKVADKPKFISDVIDAFLSKDPTIANGNAGVLTEGQEPTNYGMMRWLLSNMIISQYDISEKMASICKDNDVLMPSYGQELIIMDTLAFTSQPLLYNTLLDKMKEALIKLYPEKGANDPYFENMPVLKNLHFINGVPGAGKTEIIGFFVKHLLETYYGADGVEFVVASATQAQAEKLQKSLSRKGKNIISSHVLAWNTGETGRGSLGSYIVSAKNPSSTYDETKDHLINTGTEAPEKNLKDLVSNASTVTKRVLFFDELPLLDETELALLSKRASDAGFIVIGLGDLNQVTPMVKNSKGEDVEVGISNTVFNSSYRLTASFRETNKGQSENNKVVYNLINTVQEEIFKDRRYALSFADDKVGKTLSGAHFIHYETPNAFYGFDYFDDGNLDDTISKLKSFVNSQAHSIVIIVDNEEDKAKYDKYSGENAVDVKTRNEVLELKNKKEAQGSEYEYVLADISLSSSSYLAAKEFYTTMSRAKNGVFFKRGSLNGLSFITEKNADAASILRKDGDEKQQEAYDNYKEWRMKLYEAVPKESVSPTTSPTPVTPSPIPTTSASNDSTGDPRNVVSYNDINKKVEDVTKDWIDRVENKNETGEHSGVNDRDSKAYTTRRNINGDNKPTTLQDLHVTKNGYIDLDYFISKLNSIIDEYNKNNITSYLVPGTWTTDSDKAKAIDLIGKISSIIWHEASTKEVTGEIPSSIKSLINELDPNTSIVNSYYFYVDKNGTICLTYLNNENKPMLIPIGIIKGVKTGFYTKIPQVKRIAETILVSSEGNSWAKLPEIALGKMHVNDQEAVFLGTDESRVSPRSFAFNGRGNKGKTFGVLTEFYDNSNIEELLKPEYDGELVNYFLKLNGDYSIARLAGKSIRVTPETYIKLASYISDLLVRNVDKGARKTSIDNIRNILSSFNDVNIDKLFANIKSEAQKENKQSDLDKAEIYHLLPPNTRSFILNETIKLAIEGKMKAIDIPYIFGCSKDPSPQWGENRHRGIKLTYTDADGTHSLHVRTLLIDNKSDFKTLEVEELKDGEWVKRDGNFTIGMNNTVDSVIEKLFGLTDDIKKAKNTWRFELTVEGDYTTKNKKSEDETKYVEFQVDAESFVNSLTDELKNKLLDTIKSSDNFKHGIFLNNIPTTYLEGEDGAFWAIADSKQEESDISYIMAPLYQIDAEWGTADTPNTNFAPLVANAESWGTYIKTDNSYIFKNLRLSEGTIWGNGKSSIASIKSIEKRYDLDKNTVLDIIFEDGSKGELKGEEANNLLTKIIGNSIEESAIVIRTSKDTFTATAEDTVFKNSKGNEYVLYNINGTLYLVNNDGDIQQATPTFSTINLKPKNCAMLLYNEDLKKWNAITEASDGTLRIDGKFISDDVNIENALGYDEYISKSNEVDIEATIKDTLGDMMNASGFPKKQKSLIKWIDSVNAWLNNIENICNFAKLNNGRIATKIELTTELENGIPVRKVQFVDTDAERFKAASWYAEKHLSNNLNEILNIGRDNSGNIVLTLRGDKTIKMTPYNDSFALFSEDLETLGIPTELQEKLFPLIAKSFADPTNSDLFNSILENLSDNRGVLSKYVEKISKLTQSNPC